MEFQNPCRRALRPTLIAQIFTLFALALGAPPAPGETDSLTLNNGLTFRLVDAVGKAIDASAIPSDLSNRVQGIVPVTARSKPSATPNPDATPMPPAFGFVLAKVKLPDGEKDPYYGSQLVGKGWNGGMHYLNVGNGANPDVICIALRQKSGPCVLEVKKLKYRQITIPIPEIDPAGKIVWLGELTPQPYGAEENVWKVVRGKVSSPSGEPLNQGEATLRVNGTPSRMRSPIEQGSFAFRDVAPGAYLVEFKLDGYTAKTWWVEVKATDAEVARDILATPNGAPSNSADGTQPPLPGGIRTLASVTGAAEVGRPLDLKFTALDGREVELSRLRGKVVLIDFWATWCGPCMGEVPHVVEAYRKFHDQGFEIVGISFDQDKAAVERVTKEKGMSWPQYFDGKGWENAFGVKYGIRGIPTMWLIDKQGKIASANARQDLAGQVEKLLSAK